MREIGSRFMLLQCCSVVTQDVARLVQNAADAEDDDEEEEETILPAKPSLARPGKRGSRTSGAVSVSLF